MRRAAVALVRRPDLWAAAIRLVPRGWWRRWPPLPVPDRAYRNFRLETMYGRPDRMEADDLILYLEWCRAMRRRAR